MFKPQHLFFYNSEILDYAGKYVRLVAETSQNDKEKKYLSKENRVYAKGRKIMQAIPVSSSRHIGLVIAVFRAFKEYPHISDIGEAKAGMTTGDNDRFLRLWHEVKNSKIGMGCHNSDEAKKSEKKWFPYNKGGGFRKWYGLNELCRSLGK